MPDFSTRPRRRAVEPVEAVLLAVATFALVLAAGASWAAWDDLQAARRELAALRREADAAASRTRELETFGSDDALVTQAILTSEAPPPRVLGDLGQLLPGDARLESVTFEYGDRLELQVRVTARSAGAYDLFLGRLERSPLFGDVAPIDESRDAGVQATIRVAYRGAAW